MSTVSRRNTFVLWGVLTAINLLLAGYAIYAVATLKPGETVKTPVGEVTRPLKRLYRFYKEENGHIIAEYTDGSKDVVDIETAQTIKGDKGDTGSKGDKGDAGADGKNGENGKNGLNGAEGRAPTREELLAAIAEYCSTRNQCVGATGQKGDKGNTGNSGTNGTNGKDGDMVRCTVVNSTTVEIEIKPAGYTSWLTLAQVKGKC